MTRRAEDDATMAKSWKCARCATENAESAVSCQGCGMIRGAVVTTVNVGQTPPVPPPPVPSPPASSSLAGAQPPLESWQVQAPPVKPRRRMRLPVQLVLLALLIGGGAIYGYINNAGRSGNGDINKAGELSVNDLRVGDCFDLADPNASAVEKTAAKPCTESHQYEIFFEDKMPDGAFPDSSVVKTWVQANCLPAFATYVGQTYDNSKLEVSWFRPNSEGWSSGDHVVQCTVYDPNNSLLTASLKGAKR
jgi:hypothetical protein